MVFKGSLYLLNIICGIIPCEHKYQSPDTSPSSSQTVPDLNYDSDTTGITNATWEGEPDLTRSSFNNGTDPLLVETKTGMLRGFWMQVVGGRKIRAFEGIPFALPPLGERRFKAPLPVKPWKGILEATSKGPKCLQLNDITLSRVIGSENCLFLNIYSRMPTRKSTGKYPVLIFIHGGGFLTGSGSDFGPAYLLQRDIILVTINFRLGVLGFLSTNDPQSPGNAGLKDQAEAINWVYDNIESFNGDKGKIILLGHGSGGACVQFHLMSFKSRGKFIAGISISGTAFNHWALHLPNQALNLTKKFAKSLQCPVHGSTKNIVACLRKKRGFDLAKMQVSFLDKWPLTLSLFRPVIEDQYQQEEPFLTETPEEAYQKGTVDKVPWICGQAEDEGYTFLISHVALGTFGNLRKKWNSLAPDYFNYNDLPIDQNEITRRVNWLYFRHADASAAPIKTYSDALGTRLIYTGIHKALQAHSQHAETYAFMFGFNGKYNLATTAGIKPADWAVGHGEILGYVLNSTMYAGFQKNDSELVLSKILVNIIFNFADKQVPGFTTENGEKFHLWNPVTNPRNITFLHISNSIKMIPEPYLQQVLYWESLGLPDTLPLANYTNEIENVTTAPQANGFVSTDITVNDNDVPLELRPPLSLIPGLFSNANSTTPEKYPVLTTDLPMTRTVEEDDNTIITTSTTVKSTLTPVSITSTSTTTNAPTMLTTSSSTTAKPKFDRWIAQDFVPFVPMPDLAFDFVFNATSAPHEQAMTTPVPETKTHSNPQMFPNLIDSERYDMSRQNVPFGVSFPILPTQSNTRFVTKSQVGANYYLNSLGGGMNPLGDGMNMNINSLGADANPLGDGMNSLGGDMNSLGGDMNSLGGDMNSLGGDMNSLGGDMNSMGVVA